MENKDLFSFSDEDVVERSFHNFETNPEVVGILISIEKGTYGDQYTIEFPDKKNINIGSYTTLREKITASDIGKPIKIQYLGKEKSAVTKKEYMNFKVFIKKN